MDENKRLMLLLDGYLSLFVHQLGSVFELKKYGKDNPEDFDFPPVMCMY